MPLRYLSDDDVDLMRSMRARGYGIGALAERFRVGPKRVKKLVGDVTVEFSRSRKPAEPWELEAAVRLREKGLDIREIGRQLQRGDTTVAYWLRPGAAETRAAYEAECARLAELRREAFRLRDECEYSLSRIARRLQVSTATVHKWFSRRQA